MGKACHTICLLQPFAIVEPLSDFLGALYATFLLLWHVKKIREDTLLMNCFLEYDTGLDSATRQ